MSPARSRTRRSVTTVDAPDARSWAAGLAPGEAVDWRALEVAALRAHPRVLAQLDPGGRYNGGRRWPGRGGGTPPWVWLVLPVGLAVLGAPVWGFTTLYSESWRSTAVTTDYTTRLPVAGAFYALAVAVVLVQWVVWLRSGRARNGFLVGQAWVLVALGALGVPGALRGSRQEDLSGGELWLVVVVAAPVAAVVVAVVMRVWSGPEAPEDTSGVVPLAGVRREFAALDPAEQRAVRADLGSAVRFLERRGTVSPAEAEVAQQAEPGLVAMLMSQRPR